MFQFQWLRRLVRRHTKPMPSDYADVWKQRLSIVYMLIAWNAFGVVAYNMTKGKADWATYHGLPKQEGSPAQQWTKTLGIKNATVYRISGFNVDKYEVHNDFNGNTMEATSSEIDKEHTNTEAQNGQQLIE